MDRSTHSKEGPASSPVQKHTDDDGSKLMLARFKNSPNDKQPKTRRAERTSNNIESNHGLRPQNVLLAQVVAE